ncbi:MAG TPA: c-type cytochrome [Caulobacteraceae bacterium]|nr:c-type cytochrome [Caulobacteraceae bacterium]
MGQGSAAQSGVSESRPTPAQDGPDGFPQWAFPGPLLKGIPGSAPKFSDVQIYDRTAAVDWFPGSHPPMPDAVKGRPALYACGFCHLPQGAGRSENAALAGLPADYILRQVADFKSGARQTPDPKFGAAVNMQLTAKMAADADVEKAAKYFASLKYTKHFTLIESADVPHFESNAFVFVIDPKGPREPLGQRIIEGPDDFERFEMRDPNMTFTAYVPVGAVSRGAALAKGDGGSRPACETCHGPGLKGTTIAPPIAGRLPTGLFRQLYAFQTGARHGQGALLMKPITTALSKSDMIDLAAYVASLDPGS